jgi:hypothetical protein
VSWKRYLSLGLRVCKGRRTLREAWEVWRRREERIDALDIQAGE